MNSKKFKSYFDGISTLWFLGIKNYVVIDIDDSLARISLFKLADGTLKSIYAKKIPAYKLISSRTCEVNEDGYEIRRQINLLKEQNSIKEFVLAVSINNYKYFNVSIRKDIDEDELEIEDLIRKQLPENLNSDDFVLNFGIFSSDESIANYLVTISRREEFCQYLEFTGRSGARFTFLIPFHFSLIGSGFIQGDSSDFIDVQNNKISHYSIDANKVITKDEYLFNSENAPDRNEYDFQLLEVIKKILERKEKTNKISQRVPGNYLIESSLENSINVGRVLRNLTLEDGQKFNYQFEQNSKTNIVFESLFNDSVFNFEMSNYANQKKEIDVEKAISTRLLIWTFSFLLLSLLVMNILGMLTDNALSEQNSETQVVKEIETATQKMVEKNNELTYDLNSLINVKNKKSSLSDVLKIFSESSLPGLRLTEIKLNRNNSDGYEAIIIGEAFAKEEVIQYIKTLSGNSNLNKIELLWFDKKKSGFNKPIEPENPFRFSVSMSYRENKKS
ncbi:MAG: hypothetical protein IPM56_03195 [Ignavibacteriales bacterium]|nr:MAG: hypothetical protein IPM56_03195 [Ignavibacteriales bacterium]